MTRSATLRIPGRDQPARGDGCRKRAAIHEPVVACAGIRDRRRRANPIQRVDDVLRRRRCVRKRRMQAPKLGEVRLGRRHAPVRRVTEIGRGSPRRVLSKAASTTRRSAAPGVSSRVMHGSVNRIAAGVKGHPASGRSSTARRRRWSRASPPRNLVSVARSRVSRESMSATTEAVWAARRQAGGVAGPYLALNPRSGSLACRQRRKPSARRRRTAPSRRSRVAPPGEPGQRLRVSGVVVGADGKPIPGGASLFIYQTDDQGYDGVKPASDNRNPRLKLLLRSDAQGGLVVRHHSSPGSYPNSRAPAHIHFEGWGPRSYAPLHLRDRVRGRSLRDRGDAQQSGVLGPADCQRGGHRTDCLEVT